MKFFIILSALLLCLTIAKAENKQEIMNLLAQRIRLQDPDTLIYSEEARNRLDEFLREHRSLFDSLGKEEIFYHLQLTTDLYSDRQPGYQPHAVYAVYLYTKLENNYTEEENDLIARHFNEFFEKGWLSPRDYKAFQAARQKKSSLRPMSSTGASPRSDVPAATPWPTATGTPIPPVATPIQEQTPQPSPTAAETESKPSSSGFPIVPVVIVAALVSGILLYIIRRKST